MKVTQAQAQAQAQAFHLSIFERQGVFFLSLLFKEGYEFDWKRQHPRPLDPFWQPLSEDIVYCRHPERSAGAVLHGRDLWPDRETIDLIVTGHAHAPKGRPCSEMEVDITFEDRRARARIFGDRVAFRHKGQLRFSAPQRFSQRPIDAFHAYGGIDPHYMPHSLADTPSVLGEPVLERFPGAYPRNPCGMGYWVSPDNFIDGLRLPNIEDSNHLLRPESFFVRDPRRWPLARPPFLCGFIGLSTFPRAIFAGQDPYHLPGPEDAELRTALTRECPHEFLDRSPGRLAIGRAMMQNGSAKLRVEEREEALALKIRGMSPQGGLELGVPRPRSKIRIYERGRPRHARIKRLAVQLCTQRQRLALLCSAQVALGELQQAGVRNGIDLEALAHEYQVEIGPYRLHRRHWPQERLAVRGGPKESRPA